MLPRLLLPLLLLCSLGTRGRAQTDSLSSAAAFSADFLRPDTARTADPDTLPAPKPPPGTTDVYAPPKPFSRTFPIPARLVRELLWERRDPETLPDLGPPLPAGARPDTLAPGHYLHVTVNDDEVTYRYFHTYDHAVRNQHLRSGYLDIRVFDPAGNARADAEVLADGRPVRYRKRTGTYRRRDWIADHLEVRLGGDTLFYSLDQTDYDSRFAHDVKRVWRSRAVGYLKLPYYVVSRPVTYVIDGIRYRGNWRNYPTRNLWRRLFRKHDIVGYVATDQPQYRPGDTVRVTAYLTRRKGRPLARDEVRMVVSSRSKSLDTLVRRTEKGRYTAQFVADETWKLDEDYRIRFHTGTKRNIQPSIGFELEDYELDEYRLQVTAGEDASTAAGTYLDITTDDVNGQPLPAGTVRTILHLNRFTSVRDSARVTLPDTLHVHVEDTENRIERRYFLPDSLFPAGYAVSVTAEVQLTGPSGEYAEQKVGLTVDRRFPDWLRLDVRADSLHGYLEPSARDATPPPATATLLSIGTALDTLRETVALPFARRLDHTRREYRLLTAEQSRREELTNLQPYTGRVGYFLRDTLVLQVPNPHRQPLRWTLRRGADLLHRAETDTYRRPGFAPGEELQLDLSYLRGGEWAHVTETLTAPRYDELTSHKNILALEIDQPAKVRPGETVRVSVRATDQRGRPARNVALTSGTYNARFDEAPVTTPTYLSKRRRRAHAEQVHSTRPVSWSEDLTPPAWLVRGLELDTLGRFAVWYPDPEFRHVRSLDTIIPAGRREAHLAVFVMRDGEPETIRTIYVNNRLAYWYHPAITTPYSVPVDPGSSLISVRTNTHVYTQTLQTRARHQTIVSFDAERATAAGWTVRKLERPTNEEIMTIHDHVFAVTRMEEQGTLHFRQSNYPVVQSGRSVGYRPHWRPLGLVGTLRGVEFLLPGGDSILLPYERHALYHVTKGRDRLYPLDYDTVENYELSVQRGGPVSPGLPEYYFPEKKQWSAVTRLPSLPDLPRLVPLEPRSRVQFAGLPKNLLRLVISPVGLNQFYRLSPATSGGAAAGAVGVVSPGEYDVIYHFAGDSLRYQRIALREDHLTLIDYRTAELLDGGDFDYGTRYEEVVPEPEEPKPVLRDFSFGGSSVTGRVVDEEGEGLIGVNVLLLGSTTGAVTDLDGNFILEVPDEEFSLKFSYVGYADRTVDFGANRGMWDMGEVVLESGELLEEVVVVGYGMLRRQDIVGSVASAVEGKAAGVQVTPGAPGAATELKVRGIGGVEGKEPLYVVDGVIVPNIDGLNPALVADMTVLKDASATAIYGARGANGVVVITTGEGNGLATLNAAAEDLPEPDVRDDFRDHASFVPDVRTDGDGVATFDVTFPDDITAWNTFAVGQDRRRRIGFAEARTRSFLPLQAQLYLPRFLVRGDRSAARGLAINREGQPRSVRLRFAGEGGREVVLDTLLDQSVEQQYPITAPADRDSLEYTFSLQSLEDPTLSDGEQRPIPLYPVGAQVVSGKLVYLNRNTDRLPTDFVDAEHGPLTLRLYGNRVERLLNDLAHLADYPYHCTEQTASRVIALVSLKRVRAAEGKTFEREKDLAKALKRLRELRRPDGGYAWWPTSTEPSPWITLHAYRALRMAEAEGYAVGDLNGLERYLLANVTRYYPRLRLQILLEIAKHGNVPTDAEMESLDTLPRPNLYEILGTARLHQLRGDTVDVDRLLDTATRVAAGGIYWGRQRFGWRRQPLGERLECTLLGQHILRDAGRRDEADEAVTYLLSNETGGRRPGTRPLLGTNTLESARLLEELLPVLAEDGPLARPVVRLRGRTVNETVDSFPQAFILPPTEARSLRVERSGSGPLAVSLYQSWFERAPTPDTSGFTVSTRFTDRRERTVDYLTLGETAYLEVTVRVAKESDYVLIEVPIPAGCSYADREEARGPRAVHRAYERDRVAVFCDRLPAGRYVYRVALAPRFAGQYTVNPATAEMQYLPVVRGMGSIQEIEVR